MDLNKTVDIPLETLWSLLADCVGEPSPVLSLVFDEEEPAFPTDGGYGSPTQSDDCV